MILKREIAFFGLVFLFGLAVSLLAYSITPTDPLTLTIRLIALNGYIAVSIAAIMTPFLKEITLFFKKSFVNVHHCFAAVGLLFLTLLPFTILMQGMSTNYVNWAAFVPNFTTFYLFFFYGGTVALILIFAAFGAALVRRKIPSYWRPLHALMYLALFVGIIHANLIGIDFGNIFIKIVFDGLFVTVLAAFVLKRWQFYRIKAKVKKASLMAETNNKGSK
jgi:DMSO/TMAO reductase YedYZ heme-binding membrane subunit